MSQPVFRAAVVLDSLPIPDAELLLERLDALSLTLLQHPCKQLDGIGPDARIACIQSFVATVRTFHILRSARPQVLVDFLRIEQPQLVACVLSQLPDKSVRAVLCALPVDKRLEVVDRMKSLEDVDDGALSDIAETLEMKLASRAFTAKTG